MKKNGALKIDVITIFPGMFDAVFSESMIKIGKDKGLVDINIHDLRKWSSDKHNTVDDRPFGGGPGMVMMIDPVYKAVQTLKTENSKVVLMSAKGEKFVQKTAMSLAKEEHLIFICPHYEGIDQRVVDCLIDKEISIGDYILTGGELPAMVVIDAVSRMIPGVVGKEASVEMESYSNIKINDKISQVYEYPQYTRPAEFTLESGVVLKVPDVLLSGDHEKINTWRIANLQII